MVALLNELANYAAKTFDDEEHFFQLRGSFVIDPEHTKDHRCGMCFMGAAYYGKKGEYFVTSGSVHADCIKLGKEFDLSADTIEEIIYMNDTMKLSWYEIERRLMQGDWELDYDVP